MPAHPLDRPRTEGWNIIAVGVAVCVAVAVLFRLIGLSVLQSDPLDYLMQSREWWRMNDHLPGYAMLIWLANIATLGLLPAAVLLQTVALLCWCVSVYYVDRVLETLRAPARAWGVALYALFPFVGVTYVAWPIGDSLSHAVLIFAFYCLLQKDWRALTFALATALIVHKGLWPFALLIGLVAMLGNGYPLWQFLVSGLPLIGFWLGGVWAGGDWLWIVKIDLTRHLPSHSSLPFLDGVIGTLLSGGARGLVKGGFLTIVLATTCWLIWVYARRRAYEMLTLLLPLLALLLTMNQWEAWASIRFAKIMVVPLAAMLTRFKLASTHEFAPKGGREHIRGTRWPFWSFVGMLAATQIAFAFYIDRYFEPGGYVEQRLQAEKAAQIHAQGVK
ncbi:MAG TPA: hypothetical protein VGP72_18000 [Planctomycetota bacterium]|jgi:hypothetical protein